MISNLWIMQDGPQGQSLPLWWYEVQRQRARLGLLMDTGCGSCSAEAGLLGVSFIGMPSMSAKRCGLVGLGILLSLGLLQVISLPEWAG